MRIILVIARALVALWSARRRFGYRSEYGVIPYSGPVRVKRVKVGDHGVTVTLRIGAEEPQVPEATVAPEQVA